MSRTIVLPHEFRLRPYQQDNFRAFFERGIKRLFNVWHRRSGKTKDSINFVTAAAMQRVGVYYHAFPELTQARRVVWNGIDKTGKRYLDHIPKALIKDINKSEMRVDFINGSILQLVGSDRYNSLVGGNPAGIIFDEYSISNPLAWEYLRPILAENDGWAKFVMTPRGKNHAYEMLEFVQNSPKWHVSILGVDDTYDWDGSQIIDPSIIEEERASGMPEEKVQQEFYVSFDYGVEGAYYADQLKAAYANDRIREFEIDRTKKVDTFWDIGHTDATAIWFMQKVGSEIRMIHYYESTNQGIDHYAAYMRQYGIENRIHYGIHYGPHDLENRHFATNGKSTLEIASQYGLFFQIVPRLRYVIEGINAARNIFPRVHFHKEGCKQGLRCLQEYHRKYNEDHQRFDDRPVHNWASHGADAFRYFAVQYSQQLYDAPEFLRESVLQIELQ